MDLHLTETEQAVVDAACCGVWTGPGTQVAREELAVTDDPDLRVRAELIRELLTGRRGALDPRGLRIRSVRVVGQLDLDHVTAITGLTLVGCVLRDGVRCVHAQLREVNLTDSHLSDLDAVQLRTDGNMTLSRATVTGVVRLAGAHIGGQLNLDHAEITNDAGHALDADDLRTDNGMTLQNAVLRAAHKDGAVWLPGAHIGGQLNLDHAEITNEIGPAIHADRLRTDSNMNLMAATVTGTGQHGAVRLIGAHIGGELNLDHAVITNKAGPALLADRLRTDDSLNLRNAIVRGAGEKGAVRLTSAHIGSQLNLDHAVITNKTGPAIHADRLRTDNNLFLQDATVTGTSEQAAVRLIGAHIGYQLCLDGSTITNDSGQALNAAGLRTDGDMLLREATLDGAGKNGTVYLGSAQIGGHLLLGDAQVNNKSMDFILRQDGIQLLSESGPLIDLTEAQVTGALAMSASVVCPHSRMDRGRSTCPDGRRRVAVHGLTFPRLSGVSWQQWLHLLIHHTPAYGPQPYQQFAAVERASGHDNTARQVLIAQQEDLRRRAPDALGGRLAQVRHWLWGGLGRYGYRAHRLVIALGLVIALAGGLGYAAGQVPTRPGHHAAERVPSPTATPGTPCSTAELIGLGIDRGLPLGTTGLRARCDLDTGTRWGQAFTYAIWALQALVWALATLAIAAYTGLVRKPT